MSMLFKSRALRGALRSGLLLLLGTAAHAQVASAQNAPTPINFSGTTLTQNFNTLAIANSASNTTLPGGFGFVETGGDAVYAAGNGGDAPGGVYSFGATGASDRALGSLLSGSVKPIIGVIIRNNSGSTLTQFTVSYSGKQFRLGMARTGVADRLDFQYSTSATALNAATGFTDFDALDFTSPVTTGTVGAVTPTATAISATVTGVSVAPGANLVLRFNDFDVTGADDGLAIDDFSFSAPVAGGTPTPTATPTATPTPGGTTTGAIISEYRLSGPGGASDEFIELYNTTGSTLDVSGWTVAAGNITATIPAKTPAIPYLGHLLMTGSQYSLANYGGTGRAAGDVAYSGDIAEGTTLTLRNPSGTAVDVVSCATLPAPTAGSQYSFVRRQESGNPQDSDVDADDFNLVEVTSTAFGPNTASANGAGLRRLGTPGPQNLGNSVNRSIGFALVNPSQGANTGDNGTRTGSGNGGTLALRRALTNNSGATLTRMRLRLVTITAGTPTGTDAGGNADIRLVNSTSAVKVNGVDVKGMTVESVSGMSGGGGLNTTLSITLPSGGIPNGTTVGVEFLFNIIKSGSFKTFYFCEGGTDALDTPPPRPDDDNLLLGNPSNAMVLDSTGSNKENLLVEHPGLSLGYQKSAGGPLWVSWHLDSADIGSSGRSDFHTDVKLPEDCRITDGDYSGTGYTRGHMCPSGDRTASTTLNSDAFNMSNMLPQTAGLNNGPWGDFENYCRTLVSGGSELYIMSGGIGSVGRIAANKINAPASCWKVVVVLTKGTNDIGRITTSTRVLAVIMPNTTSVSGTYSNYYTSVDNIESQTGLDLLSALPDNIENVLEAKVGS